MQKTQPEFTKFLGFIIFIIFIHGGALFYFYKSFTKRGEFNKKNKKAILDITS